MKLYYSLKITRNMKKALFYITTITGSLLCAPVFAQNTTPDSLGLLGDNLNLYAVLDLFQKSETLEEFEKSLNAEKSKLNNLDLNNDNKVDYIRVVDHFKGTAHAIVLQVPINNKETQDVAVIEVDKEDENNVKIQLIGDEMLYGKNYIVEPKQNDAKTRSTGSTPNPGYANGGNGANNENGVSGGSTNVTNNYYNDNTSNYNNATNDYWYPIATWSIIRWMYYPSYVAYVSPWSWGYNPWYWNAWTPVFWHSYYYGCVTPYWGYYNNCFYRSNMIANSYAHDYYYGSRRSTSASVNQRRSAGEYKTTYSRPDLASKQAHASNRPSYNKASIASRNANSSAQKQDIGQKVSRVNSNTGSDVKSANGGNSNKYSTSENNPAKESNSNTSKYSKYPSSESGSSNKYSTSGTNPAKESNSNTSQYSKYPSSNGGSSNKYSTSGNNPAKESSSNASQYSKYPSSNGGSSNKYSTSGNNSVKEVSKPSSSSSSLFNSSSSMGSGSSKPSSFGSGSSRSFGGGGGSSSSFGGGGGGRSSGGGSGGKSGGGGR